MIYLLLAIASSTLISVIMRLSADKTAGNAGMLAVNYLTCTFVAGIYAGFGDLFPGDPALPGTLGMGVIHGALYLFSFVLFQTNVKKNGVVLSAIFQRLGLLVPLTVSVFLFGEMPTLAQTTGFVIAVGAIILINLHGRSEAKGIGSGLIVLLLANGAADAMSKVYEEMGSAALSDQFLFYTFASAFLFCTGLVLLKKERIGKNELLFGVLIGIPNFFSAKFLLASLNRLPAVIVYPTYSVAAILAVSLAGVVLFKERLKQRQWIAIGAILAALVMLNV